MEMCVRGKRGSASQKRGISCVPVRGGRGVGVS